MDATITFCKSQKIPIFTPGDEEYERSVAISNLLYRFARPGCVIQPQNDAHVMSVVLHAKTRKIRLTIKNGGHSYAGFSTTDEGISLDLCQMNKVTLDMKSNTATLQGGAQWGHAYKQLVNGRHDGFIINGGRCPTVGVSGFTLGGGLGPFTRSFGMGCDTLKEATIVLADGRKITVKDSDDKTSNEGKLFWALRGAGGGNFGVVVQMKMNVRKLKSKDGTVVAGRYVWYPNRNGMDDFMKTMNSFYTTDWPDQITLDSSWLCDLQKTDSDLGVRFIVYYDGNKNDFDKLIAKYIKQKDLVTQLKRRSMPEKSSRFFHETLVSQWSEEIKKAFPKNKSYTIYSSFVFQNDEDRIKSITSIIRARMKAFRSKFPGEKALLQVTWIHAGGEVKKKKPSETAFRWRAGVYHAYIMIEWEEKFLEQDMRGFLNDFKKELRPFSMFGRATFINFPDGLIRTNAHERAYYGNNRQELQRIKKIWDKDNFFKWAHGVRLPQPEKKIKKAKVANSARVQRMENFNLSAESAANIAMIDGSDDEGDFGPLAMAADEEYSDEESVVDEQNFTDVIAARQWETVELPSHPKKPYVGGSNTYVGDGIFDLNDLGF